jgi:GNAT superfamily N-acetyltransferase
MGSADIKIVKGDPNHAEAVARLLPLTSDNRLAYVYNNRLDVDTKLVSACWRMKQTMYSHSFGTVALQGESVVGVLIAYDSATYKSQRIPTAEAAARFINDELMLHMKQVLPLTYLLSPVIPRSAYFVNYLAVAENTQGKGIGAKLMTRAFEQARESGCRTLQLDVVADRPAVKFYKKLGLEILVETSVPKLKEVADIGASYRMVKEIC